jgi:methyltransferase (TIGR00027 family)
MDSVGDSRISETAVGAAMMRAHETAQSDALFKDPYAAAFVAASQRPFEDLPDPDGQLARLEEGFRTEGAIRTRFFDDYVTAASRRGIRQVVLLGAGLDTRAFRLSWQPDAHVFEIDLPGVLDFKDRILDQEGARPRCARTVVTADLLDDWSSTLLGSGFAADTATAWTAEGLIVYFPAESAIRFVDALTALSAPGSELAFDDASPNALITSALASMWHEETTTEVTRWLQAHRWTTATQNGSDLAHRYRRQPGSNETQFVTATFTG